MTLQVMISAEGLRALRALERTINGLLRKLAIHHRMTKAWTDTAHGRWNHGHLATRLMNVRQDRARHSYHAGIGRKRAVRGQ